jgi:hypothetical protein
MANENISEQDVTAILNGDFSILDDPSKQLTEA